VQFLLSNIGLINAKKLFVFNAETFTKFMLSNESKKYYKNVQDFLITLKLSFMNLNVKER
jgi:hypothetical protein